jgi:hypothetical protein
LEFGTLLEVGGWILVLSLPFVHDSDDHPSHGTFLVTDRFASCHAIGGNDDLLMQGGTMSINGHLRQAFRLAQPADRLAYQQPPTLQASMLPGGDHIAFYAGEEHSQTSKDQHPTSRETPNPKFQIPSKSQAPKSPTTL